MPTPSLPRIRRAESADEPALWEMLTFAASMTEGDAVAIARADEYLASYVRGFGTRAGDFGLVAEERREGSARVIAAAWLRLGDEHRGPSAVATPTEPELAIAARPDARGRGIGTLILTRLLEEAPFDAIVLSVRIANPSERLYRRLGFETIRTVVNRVGGDSLVMRRARPVGT